MILLLLAALQASDWPGLLGPARDGKSPEKGLRLPWPPGGPRVVWQLALGEGFGACAVADGRAFVFDRHGGQARLTCLKSRTGEELWRFEYAIDYSDRHGSGDGPRCCPVVDGDLAYIFDPAGLLHAVRVSDGKPAWRKDTSKDFDVEPNFFGVGSTPVVEGELLIALVGGAKAGIVAFDKRTGEVKYKVTDEPASYASPMVATVKGRRWGFVHGRDHLVGFDPASGKVDFLHEWRAPMRESVNVCNPVVAGDLVFVSEAYGMGSSVVRVRPGGCEEVWKDGRKRDKSMACYLGTPVHVDGHLYGSSGQGKSEAELRCVELATGKVKWSVPGLTRCALTYVDGHFVCLGEEGVLRLVKADPERYEEVAKAVPASAAGEPLLSAPAWAAPVVSHGLLYVRGRDRLVCAELLKP